MNAELRVAVLTDVENLELSIRLRDEFIIKEASSILNAFTGGSCTDMEIGEIPSELAYGPRDQAQIGRHGGPIMVKARYGGLTWQAQLYAKTGRDELFVMGDQWVVSRVVNGRFGMRTERLTVKRLADLEAWT